MSDEPKTPADTGTDSASQPSAGVKSSDTPAVQVATEAFMRLEQPQRLLLIGSSLTFVLGFLPWYSFSSLFGGISFNGYDATGGLFGFTSVLTVALLVLPTLHQAVLGNLTQKNVNLVLLGLASATLFLGPMRWILSGGPGELSHMPTGASEGYSAGKTLWFWLAFLAACTAVFGAFKSLREQMASGQ